MFGMALDFIGFDYSFGLFVLVAAYASAGCLVLLTVLPWLAASYYLTQLILVQGLFFWSALLGLEWSLPAQLTIFGGGLALGMSLAWVWSLRGEYMEMDEMHGQVVSVLKHAPITAHALLLIMASQFTVEHHRVALTPVETAGIAGLSLVPFAALSVAVCATFGCNWRWDWMDMKANYKRMKASFVFSSRLGDNKPSWKTEPDKEALDSERLQRARALGADFRSPVAKGRSPGPRHGSKDAESRVTSEKYKDADWKPEGKQHDEKDRPHDLSNSATMPGQALEKAVRPAINSSARIDVYAASKLSVGLTGSRACCRAHDTTARARPS